jgi:hypothetical protein
MVTGTEGTEGTVLMYQCRAKVPVLVKNQHIFHFMKVLSTKFVTNLISFYIKVNNLSRF